MTVPDYVAQVKVLRQSLEQAAGSIGLNVNANKTEYMCFKLKGTTEEE